MTTPRPTLIHAMDSSQGAAMRIQLDAMITALTAGGTDSIDATAIDAHDTTTSRLIARLFEAREAAREIETRTPPAPHPHTLTIPPRGVRFRRTH